MIKRTINNRELEPWGLPAPPAIPAATTAQLCVGIPFTRDYKHTILFSDQAAQYQYIASKAIVSLDHLTPAKIGEPIRVPQSQQQLSIYNYLILSNASTWNAPPFYWYCFITDLEYVNPQCTLVKYEVDVLQTWLFHIQLGQCIIEREHVTDDIIGKHTLDEGIPVTQYICNAGKRMNLVTSDIGVRVITAGVDGTPIYSTSDRVFSGVRYEFFKLPDDYDALVTYINNYRNTPNEVVGLQMFPYSFLNENKDASVRKNIEYTIPVTIDGYTPRNNKLFCYPYNTLFVDNSQGESQTYKFEDWNGATPYFVMACNLFSGGDIVVKLTPGRGYGGFDLGANVAQTLTMSGFPQCAWASDSFYAYMAQNINTMTGGMVKDFLHVLPSMFMGAATGDYFPALAAAGQWARSSSDRVVDYITMTQQAEIQPDKVHGSFGANVDWTTAYMDFYFYQRTIKAEEARKIDDYFTKYGYKTMRLATPNLHTRQRFNYIKTVDAIIGGNIGTTDRELIKKIFDNGITFWHGDFVGDYTTANPIYSG